MAIRDQQDGRRDAAVDRERPREVANESRPSGSTRARGGRSNRGFASMDPNKQREIASKGGRAAHAKGTAHEFNSEEARDAGRKGGQAVSRNREHMAAIGRRGGEARGHARRQQAAASGGNTGGGRTPRGGGGQGGGLTDREVSIGGTTGTGTPQGAAASGTSGTSGSSLGGERRGGSVEPSRPNESVERP
jgi:uncharacterized protein